MLNPFDPLYRLANEIQDLLPSPAAEHVIAAMLLIAFGAFWGGLALLLTIVAPLWGFTHWLTANCIFIMGGTVVVYAIYHFTRHFFETKTGD